MKLRAKFSLLITLFISIVVIAMAAVSVVSERRLLLSQMQQHQQQTVQRLARVCAESLYQDDLMVVNYLQTLKDEKGLVAAAFVDGEGRVRSHSDPAWMGRSFADQHYDQEVLSLQAPVKFGTSEAGAAWMVLSKKAIDDQLKAALMQSLRRVGLVTVIVLLIGVLGALLLAKTLVDPIQEVVSGMHNVSEGRLEPIALTPRKDELGWLGQELNVTVGKLKELEQMKRDFVAGITHNLKSPLVAMKSYIQMLMQGLYGAVPPSQNDVLMNVQNNASRLMGLIDNLLVAARIESKKLDISASKFDVAQVIGEILALYQALAAEKKLTLTAAVNTPVFVWADQEKTFQIITNLISNALKFTSRGGVSVALVMKPPFVEVHVTDTGAGISAAEKERIFEKFYRVQETSKMAQGTGLGLFIVRSFVEAQGGKIWLSDNPGGGTVFSFSLPQPNAKRSER